MNILRVSLLILTLNLVSACTLSDPSTWIRFSDETKNTPKWVFDSSHTYTGETLSGTNVQIHYPLASAYPLFATRFDDYFTAEIGKFNATLGKNIPPGAEYHADYTVFHSGSWDTIRFKITQNTGNGLIESFKVFATSPEKWKLYTIEDIISKRYLYTLKKESEKQLSWATLDPWYKTFWDFLVSDTSFIFTFSWGQSVQFLKDSYFFDIYNKKYASSTPLSWSGKYIALTFDDGPNPKTTPRLLDILKKEWIHATFYQLGQNIDRYPEVTKRLVEEWHEVGSHSYSHVLFTKLGEKWMQEEIYKTDQAIYKATGTYPRTIRHPYGAISPSVLPVWHMPSILWDIDPYDWKTRNVAKNITAVKNVQAGDIILYHDIYDSTIDSIPTIIKDLKSRGFTFVTISELLWLQDDIDKEAGKKCNRQGNCK